MLLQTHPTSSDCVYTTSEKTPPQVKLYVTFKTFLSGHSGQAKKKETVTGVFNAMGLSLRIFDCTWW